MTPARTAASAMVEYRTARRDARISPLLRWWLHETTPRPIGRALVFGAGLSLEGLVLAERGWAVDVLDTIETVRRREDIYSAFGELPGCGVITHLSQGRGNYSLIVVTHVLEFIPPPRRRLRFLEEMGRQLTPEGDLLLSLRGWDDVLATNHRAPMEDGIVTGVGTFARGYDRDQAEALVRSAGLTVSREPDLAPSRHCRGVRFVCRRSVRKPESAPRVEEMPRSGSENGQTSGTRRQSGGQRHPRLQPVHGERPLRPDARFQAGRGWPALVSSG